MSDTIAAIATAPGPSAIGVVRLSGPDTCTVLDRVFRPKNGRPMSRQEPRRLVLGDVLDRDGQVIDSALAVLFPGPGSYTGQDCGELQCHGSPVVLDAALAAMLAAGARQAKGGEFTRRAFLNGRMDLLQAEAVADLIDAETAQAAHNAVGQLEGVLSRTVTEIYDGLMAIVSRFYAVVDYPDEDIGDLQREDMLDTLRRAENRLEELLATFSRGKLLKLGVPTVILGRPNVGKSSLLNKVFGRKNLVKVSATPGKTANINFFEVDGIRFVDLPGYGYAKVSMKERERWANLISGYFDQERSFNVVLSLVDIRHEAQKLDLEMVGFLKEQGLPFLVVLTKADKLSRGKQDQQAALLSRQLSVPRDRMIVTSSETGQGIDELKSRIAEACL